MVSALAQDCCRALPGLDRDPAYEQIRAHPLARPDLMTLPPGQDRPDQLGRTAENALRYAASFSPPSQAAGGIIGYAEGEQRARIQRETEYRREIRGRISAA